MINNNNNYYNDTHNYNNNNNNTIEYEVLVPCKLPQGIAPLENNIGISEYSACL